LTGLFLSHAGLNRFTPHATLLLVLAANAPDIDILTLAGGGLNYFHFHRHLTHSLLFAPVMAATLAGIFRVSVRKPFPFLPAFFVALAGIASHLLLDLTNSYGERLLLPFSGRWLSLDICAIYDMWIWSFFALCLIAPTISTLVGGEIGVTKTSPYPSRVTPVLALAFLVFYDGGRAILHQRALAILDSREYLDSPALRVAAFPNPTNPLTWRGLAETPGAYRLFDLDLLSTFNPNRFQAVFQAQDNASIEKAKATKPFRILFDFSRFPVWQYTPTGDAGAEVNLSDVNFPFVSSAIFDSQGKLLSTAFHFSR
jgi:inner membrane protein